MPIDIFTLAIVRRGSHARRQSLLHLSGKAYAGEIFPHTTKPFLNEFQGLVHCLRWCPGEHGCVKSTELRIFLHVSQSNLVHTIRPASDIVNLYGILIPSDWGQTMASSKQRSMKNPLCPGTLYHTNQCLNDCPCNWQYLEWQATFWRRLFCCRFNSFLYTCTCLVDHRHHIIDWTLYWDLTMQIARSIWIAFILWYSAQSSGPSIEAVGFHLA